MTTLYSEVVITEDHGLTERKRIL